jgi:hypothetical protein
VRELVLMERSKEREHLEELVQAMDKWRAFLNTIMDFMLIPVAVRSKAWVFGRSLTRIVGSNTTGAWMSVSCECCVLSGRGLCDELVPRPEESYRVSCVSNVCDHETSTKRGGPSPYRAVKP